MCDMLEYAPPDEREKELEELINVIRTQWTGRPGAPE
jgi:hypothetical protein